MSQTVELLQDSVHKEQRLLFGISELAVYQLIDPLQA